MKRSYILLSLIVSQALCADTTTDLVANFGGKGSGDNGYPTDIKISGTTDATSGTDWTGSDTSLSLITDNLTFTFSQNNTLNNLIINNSSTTFNFTNSSTSTTPINATIKAESSSLKTLTIGNATYSSNVTNLGKNIALTIEGFDNTNVVSKLTIADSSTLEVKSTNFTNSGTITLSGESATLKSGNTAFNNTGTITLSGANSTLDASSATSFKNDGGISLSSSTSTLKVNGTLTNNGVILMRNGSKIESVSTLAIDTSGTPPKQGSIIAQGETTIASSGNLTIKNQDIKIQNLVSKDTTDSSKGVFSQATLTLSGTSTLTLGTDSSNGVVNIIGELQKASNSLTDEAETNIGKLVLSGFTSIDAKNVNFKNVNVTSANVASMTLDSGILGLENTSITLAPTSTISATTASTITLAGQNTISVGESGSLTIKGEHNFSGSGSLDFVGSTVNLGNGSGATLGVSGSSDKPTIGVSAGIINTNSFTLTGLTLQTIGSSSITNTLMTLSGSIIESIDSEGNLANLSINGSSGTINIANATSATLRGQNISITGQTINLNDGTDKLTSLTLQAESGGVTLDTVTVSGKNVSLKNNAFNLNTSLLTLKGKVTLENVAMTSDRDITIIGTAEKKSTSQGLFIVKSSTPTLPSASTLFIGTKGSDGTRFHSLTFASQGLDANQQAYISINGSNTTVDFRASSFTFQNQEIDLANNTNGTELRLFAYGNGLIDNKYLEMGGSSPTDQLSGSGVFDFNNTTFSDGTGSEVALYAGSGGVTVLPSNLTLGNVSMSAKIIDNNGGSSLNALDLSSTEGSINILGASTISASKFVYGDSQGIGVDITVGSGGQPNQTQQGAGQLTISSSDTSDTFIIGGNLTLDNTASGTTLNINLNNNQAQAMALKTPPPNPPLTAGTLSLKFDGGGLTAIGDTTNTMTVIAKDFTFSNRLDSNGEITSTPFVKVQKTELTLNMNNSNGKDNIELVGTTYLLGDTGTNEAKLKATKGTSNNQANQITLKLHDIEASGKASIQENKLSFENSNITVSDSDSSQGLLLKDASSSLTDNTLAGTINSVALKDGNLSFQYNSNSKASITLNADSTITSSGTSTLTLETIKVGSGTTDLYSLNVTDGTFSLVENTKGDQLGNITLGSEDSQGGKGADFVYYKDNTTTPPPNPEYNDLTLKGNLTSYGDSSITVKTFTISAKDSDKKEKYKISSAGGELKLIAQGSSALTATADITLNNGSLGYYGKDNTLVSLSLDSSSSISSVGNSTLQANALNVNGASISASEGTLTLKGISSSTTAGDVYVGNKGILTLQNTNTKLATLKIQDSKSLTLSADVGYITPSNPLGDGGFGQVNVQSLLFESKSGSLINIALNSSSSTSSYSDSLFALREGAKVLITTEDGIKKKETNASYTDITLSDITTDTSGLTSITLTPLLEGGTNTQGKTINAKNLLLDLRVSQTNVTQLIESIKDANAKESMTSIVNSGNNALILESIMQSEGNAFKVGMAQYISNGNVAVVQTALDYINGAMTSLSDSMFASNKIYELIAMLKSANVENRMVRAKNPFMAKTQLASLVKSLVGTAYASSDDSLLLEEESSTPNYGEIWASFDGAMSFSQEESGNSSLYGFSAGYDTLVGEKKNYLLGFYASYGYGAYSVNYARNNSHNFGLGFYTRMSFENSEVDLILSQTVGLNHTDIDLGASNSYAAQMLKQTLAYNFYTTDIEARYGYVFKVGNEDSPYYFRPFGGINFALIVNSGARGDGAAELGIEAMNTYQLSVSVGVEMRKYFGDENYLYLLPVLQKGLLNDGAGANVGFYGAENIKVTPAYNVDTTMAVYLGGQGSIGENLAVNGGVGVKVGFEKKDLLTNWNVGLRYKF